MKKKAQSPVRASSNTPSATLQSLAPVDQAPSAMAETNVSPDFPSEASPMHWQDVQGATRLITQAVLGVSVVAQRANEAIWHQVLRPMKLQQTPVEAIGLGLTRVVFGGVRGVTRGLGWGFNTAMALGLGKRATSSQPRPNARRSRQRETLLSVLNGVLGDHLHATQNPLALSMTLRHRGEAIDLKCPQITSSQTKILIVLHGLCMNDLQWTQDNANANELDAGVVHQFSERKTPQGVSNNKHQSHSAAISAQHDYATLDVHYNSGLGIAENGALLSKALTKALAAWPEPVDEIAFLAHSMGGLVVRHALQVGSATQASWIEKVNRLAFLGTPHLGAALERGGHWFETILGQLNVTRPYVALGQLRSLGIQDLRHGLVESNRRHSTSMSSQTNAAESTQQFDHNDSKRALNINFASLDYLAIAACLTKMPHERKHAVVSAILGDGLVSMDSALQNHAGDIQLTDGLVPNRRQVVEACGHLELLHHPKVRQHLLTFFSGRA